MVMLQLSVPIIFLIIFVRNKYRMENYENFIQKLFSDGIRRQEYQKRENIYICCGQCSQKFTLTQYIPQLLQCGHVCCRICLSSKLCQCCYPQINRPKKVKIYDYKFLLMQHGQLLYNIAISYFTSNKLTILNNKSAQTTISELLISHYIFSKFEDQQKNKTIIAISPKQYRYGQIKDRTLNHFSKYLKRASSGYHNIIVIRGCLQN